MINKLKIILLITFLSLFSCKAQQNNVTKLKTPKIDNYTKGELEIKVAPFGLNNNEITVGKILKDGSIHFNWPEIDITTIKNSGFFMTSIKKSVEMFFCNDEKIEENNDQTKTVNTKNLYLYKYGQPVGALYPATQKEMEDNTSLNRHTSLVLGNTISWFYSDRDGKFKAKCIVNQEWENSYNFKEITNYDLKFNKGWNIVQHSLLEKEDWKNDKKQGSLPKLITKKTISNIPSTINWYLKYWANDELLEIEQKLVKLKPITKKHYESWLPKRLGKLKRTSYEIGKKLKRMPTLNNVNLLFKKNAKTINLTIVDCAGNKEVASVYTLMKDIASRDWKDDKETGYESASSMDDKRVMITYNEKEAKTTLNYNSNERFLVKAEAINIKAEELWKILKKLKLEKLNN